MSYDVYLEADTGGPDLVDVWWANHTSNTSRMWSIALGDKSLRDLDGHEAGVEVERLAAAVARMEAAPRFYRRFNPENGWGSYDTALDFLRELTDACRRHPKTTIRVSA